MEKHDRCFDALLERREKLLRQKQEWLLSNNLLPTNASSSSENSENVRESTSAETVVKETTIFHNKKPIEHPAASPPSGAHPVASISDKKTNIEEMEYVIENSDTETSPIKPTKAFSKIPVKYATKQPETRTKQLATHIKSPLKRAVKEDEKPIKRYRTRSLTPVKQPIEGTKTPIKRGGLRSGTPDTPIKRGGLRSGTPDKRRTTLLETPSKLFKTPSTTPFKHPTETTNTPIQQLGQRFLTPEKCQTSPETPSEHLIAQKSEILIMQPAGNPEPYMHSEIPEQHQSKATQIKFEINKPETPIKNPPTKYETPIKLLETSSAPIKHSAEQSNNISLEPFQIFSTPIKYSKEQPTTPLQQQMMQDSPTTPLQQQMMQDSPSLVTTSTFCLPITHNYFTENSPRHPLVQNSPKPIKNDTVMTEYHNKTGSRVNAKKYILPLLEKRPVHGAELATEIVDVTTSPGTFTIISDVLCSTARPEIAFNATAPMKMGSGISSTAPTIILQEANLSFAGAGNASEIVQEITRSLDTTVASHGSTSKTLPETAFAATAEARIHPGPRISSAAALTVPQEVYLPLSKDGFGDSVIATDDLSPPKVGKPTNTDTSVLENDNASSSTNARLTTTQKRRKRRKATKFNKSCLDFQSDNEDFSAGSSDLWTGSTASESDLSCDEEKKRKKKKSKVNEADEENVKITKKVKRHNIRKTNKKLKDEGKQYTTRKGIIVRERSMKANPCVPEKCKRGCYNVSEERRNSIFLFYWGLNVQRRRDWLIRCAKIIPVQRKRDKTTNLRKNTFDYYINDGEDHKKVCQKFLLETLDITQKFLLYNLYNENEGMSQREKRTRKATNKYSEEAKVYVHTFIEKLPACPSHYNRKNSKRMYLQPELKNLSNLFKIYLEDCKLSNQDTVSEGIFREIFNADYDLGFHTPKKDKCTVCTKAETFANEMTDTDREKLKIHLEEKEAMYKRFKAHQTFKDGETQTCSFDLQKVLNTPYGQSMLLYYSRKYAVFNLTVYESTAQNVFCFTWGECDGKRGGIEIASCLYQYLKELDKKKFKNALLYCDSCTGQNKNKLVLSVLNYFLHYSNNLQVIQINYLLPGHTYMPADSVHATIEAEVKKLIVWTPSQWASYFESARKNPRPYSVVCMEHSDFMDWEALATKTFTKETAKNIKFKEIRIATFKKKNLNQIELKYSMKEEALCEKVQLFQNTEKKVKGKGKGKTKGKGKGKMKDLTEQNERMEHLQVLDQFKPLPKYPQRLPLSAAKYKDLTKLCSDGTIPKRFHKEFQEMPYDGKIVDILIDTDEEDEPSSEGEEETV